MFSKRPHHSPSVPNADRERQSNGLPAERYGLHECHGGSSTGDNIVDIVFVHGLTGSCWNTWTEEKTGTFWPRDLLPDRVQNARILTYGYDADVVNLLSRASQNRIANHASNLANRLAILRDDTDTEDRPLIFVAHSLGGLVCKKAFSIANGSAEAHVRAVASSTRAFAFLGVPHHGSDLASWAKLCGNLVNLAKKTNTALLGVLTPDSEVLADISRDFHTAVKVRNQDSVARIDITCFYEELEVPGVGMIVPFHSAIIPDVGQISIHADHVHMTKFNSLEHPGFKDVSGQLRRWARNIGKEVQGGVQQYPRMPRSSAYDTQWNGDLPQQRPQMLIQGQNIVSGQVHGKNVIAGSNISGSTVRFGG